MKLTNQKKQIHKNLTYIIFFTILLYAIFHTYPNIDIFISNIFFSNKENFFTLENNIFLLIIDKSTYLLAIGIIGYNAISILCKTYKSKTIVFQKYKKELFIISAFIFGSLILIQGFTKPYFGRSRPDAIIEFGGKKSFTTAFEISNQCKKNCSFVSFHTSIGVLIFAYSFFVVKKRKIIFTSILITTTLGLTRIMQGRHFFSDIVFSACLMLITMHILYICFEILETNKKVNN
ncbi:MAG: lipid A 4'-phosphatase [Candidatus Midichloriaceae bacterium]|jgi:lipid A 4'-phosphatase